MLDQYASRGRDFVLLESLAEIAEPTSYDKVMLGSLLMRYQHDPGFLPQVQLVVKAWNLTEKSLFEQCRDLWNHGFRLDAENDQGSAWDANAGE